jgi:biotin synthase
MDRTLLSLTDRVLQGEEISQTEAYSLMEFRGREIYELLAAANLLRDYYQGNRVSLCAIINAKSGRCPEDCAFCAQSSHYGAKIKVYPLVDPEVIVRRAKEAWEVGARRFSIVTSGKSLTESEVEKICLTIKGISKENKVQTCASLGMLSKEEACALKEAGLWRYHHNLETSRGYFPKICSTHSYDENIRTIKIAQEAGFKVCCGGIFGMGESVEDRIMLAFTLKALRVDSIPVNFLNPIPGTKLEGTHLLNPLECLKILAVLRFILPTREIITCGGREQNLRSLQSLMFFAGASGTMLGNYLTTEGRRPEEDLQLIKDLELIVDES